MEKFQEKYQSNRLQLAVTLRNQYYLPNRHVFMECRMVHLDEQSHLLHELKQAIQCHPKYSAKFYGNIGIK
ncbi:unnamed protein product [Rotaria sordida]|uniref:Uncharacterized protein n=1 Tax=Rotaria sordida TaxID=392033 RepID=A0A815AAP7_9BILA|nr:unnamed protein product [Rotaria sordida]